MASSNIIQTCEVLLRLSSEEAAYLRGLLQNYPGDPAQENQEERQMRKSIFNCLPAPHHNPLQVLGSGGVSATAKIFGPPAVFPEPHRLPQRGFNPPPPVQ